MMIELTKQPIFFNRNQVYRVYKGGYLYGEFIGEPQEDGNFPEEWIASTVHAANNSESGPLDGLSIIEGTDITLKELGEKFTKEMYGNRTELGVLVKYLDSAIRLPLQAHPDVAYSQKYFNSEHGKTEMWLILDTREDASICFGFKDKLTKEEFSELVERSKDEKQIMEDYINKVPVKVGEVYLVPAKSVHAIGAGCFMLEVQEPTDFTISPEYWCGDYILNAHEMYMGLSKDAALDCFDFSVCGEESINIAKKTPQIKSENENVKCESLISNEDTPYFSVNRYQVKKEVTLADGTAIYIVTSGAGSITGENYNRELKKGDYFFLPYYAKNKFKVIAKNDLDGLELIECLAPEVK